MGSGSQDTNERPTVSVAEAASRLGLTPKRVHQMLSRVDNQLTGPPRPGRGRGRRTLVYVDSLDAEVERRRGAPTRQRSQHRLASRVTELETELTELKERLSLLEETSGGDSTHAGGVADLRWALRQLNAATDGLHQAAGREEEIRTLQVEVTDRLNRALQLMSETSAMVRQADQLRSEVLGVLLTPRDPNNG
jgi:hypothetical protein